ncbi:hypothetical protein MKL09_25270 [Methylobacterium sp. J-048]|uniref:hypothetical protein n=1 Tax=Methylobacterium sp. J-048 TaxID=2836635 RepID=UPI001FBAC177|nr:hypothetical protein [Methylobacterium sp. J-048]MCJ2059828.1 hypothetical protein [Methylobacterium sp. J-048]
MFDQILWEWRIMMRAGEVSFWEGGNLVGGLTIVPVADPSGSTHQPEGWQSAYRSLDSAGSEDPERPRLRIIGLSDLQRVLPQASALTWREPLVDVLKSRVILDGRDSRMTFGFSVENPGVPADPSPAQMADATARLQALKERVFLP